MTVTEHVPPATTTSTSAPWLRRRLPTLGGIVVAALTAYGVTGGAELAPILAASGLVYLGAAALRRPASAWPVFFGTFVVMTISKVIGGPDPTWIFLGLAVLFAAYGLARGAARPTHGLPVQALAMVVVGAAAAVTLLVDGDLGGYLVAAGLLGHAAWDAYHHWTNRVVARSMAEFCFVLDTLVAVAIIAVVATT
jgi:hypothetical protein